MRTAFVNKVRQCLDDVMFNVAVLFKACSSIYVVIFQTSLVFPKLSQVPASCHVDLAALAALADACIGAPVTSSHRTNSDNTMLPSN